MRTTKGRMIAGMKTGDLVVSARMTFLRFHLLMLLWIWTKKKELPFEITIKLDDV
jgi:hypothetical protein